METSALGYTFSDLIPAPYSQTRFSEIFTEDRYAQLEKVAHYSYVPEQASHSEVVFRAYLADFFTRNSILAEDAPARIINGLPLYDFTQNPRNDIFSLLPYGNKNTGGGMEGGMELIDMEREGLFSCIFEHFKKAYYHHIQLLVEKQTGLRQVGPPGGVRRVDALSPEEYLPIPDDLYVHYRQHFNWDVFSLIETYKGRELHDSRGQLSALFQQYCARYRRNLPPRSRDTLAPDALLPYFMSAFKIKLAGLQSEPGRISSIEAERKLTELEKKATQQVNEDSKRARQLKKERSDYPGQAKRKLEKEIKEAECSNSPVDARETLTRWNTAINELEDSEARDRVLETLESESLFKALILALRIKSGHSSFTSDAISWLRQNEASTVRAQAILNEDGPELPIISRIAAERLPPGIKRKTLYAKLVKEIRSGGKTKMIQ